MMIDIAQLEFIDSDLRNILVDLETATGMEFTITSIYRIGDQGVHGQLPVRGIDLRCRDVTIGKIVEEFINSRWKYDKKDKKKCCFCHGTDLHLHIQTSEQTTKR